MLNGNILLGCFNANCFLDIYNNYLHEGRYIKKIL